MMLYATIFTFLCKFKKSITSSFREMHIKREVFCFQVRKRHSLQRLNIQHYEFGSERLRFLYHKRRSRNTGLFHYVATSEQSWTKMAIVHFYVDRWCSVHLYDVRTCRYDRGAVVIRIVFS
jgi:hypothetical protein